MTKITQVCLLGFGEVGQTLAEDLTSSGDLSLCTFDIKFSDRDSIPSRALESHSRVRGCDSAEAAANGCELVVSAVTAAEDLAATQSVVPGLGR